MKSKCLQRNFTHKNPWKCLNILCSNCFDSSFHKNPQDYFINFECSPSTTDSKQCSPCLHVSPPLSSDHPQSLKEVSRYTVIYCLNIVYSNCFDSSFHENHQDYFINFKCSPSTTDKTKHSLTPDPITVHRKLLIWRERKFFALRIYLFHSSCRLSSKPTRRCK